MPPPAPLHRATQYGQESLGAGTAATRRVQAADARHFQ